MILSGVCSELLQDPQKIAAEQKPRASLERRRTMYGDRTHCVLHSVHLHTEHVERTPEPNETAIINTRCSRASLRLSNKTLKRLLQFKIREPFSE